MENIRPQKQPSECPASPEWRQVRSKRKPAALPAGGRPEAVKHACPPSRCKPTRSLQAAGNPNPLKTKDFGSLLVDLRRQRRPDEKQRLFRQIHHDHTVAALSNRELINWIEALVQDQANKSFLGEAVRHATGKMAAFSSAQMAILLKDLSPIASWNDTVELFNQAAVQLSKEEHATSREWTRHLTTFARCRYYAPEVAKQALTRSELAQPETLCKLINATATAGIIDPMATKGSLALSSDPDKLKQIGERSQYKLLWSQVLLLGEERKSEAYPLIDHLLPGYSRAHPTDQQILYQAALLTDHPAGESWPQEDIPASDVTISAQQKKATETVDRHITKDPRLTGATVVREATCGYSSVDILIPNLILDWKPVAIEVDGGQHYAVNGPYLTGASLLKRRMIEKKGWHLITIRTAHLSNDIAAALDTLGSDADLSS